jgi:hypothetical protein
MLENDVEILYANYVQAEYPSSGALLRLLMNGLPAAAFFVWRSRFQFSEAEARLWMWFAILSFVLLGPFVVSPSSSAVDRVALYFLPLQLVMFSHLPFVIRRLETSIESPALAGAASSSKQALSRDNVAIVSAAVLVYNAVLFVWLNLGANSFGWIPYRLVFFSADDRS